MRCHTKLKEKLSNQFSELGTRGALDIVAAGTNRQSLQGVITG